jgi:hypothetical protein
MATGPVKATWALSSRGLEQLVHFQIATDITYQNIVICTLTRRESRRRKLAPPLADSKDEIW